MDRNTVVALLLAALVIVSGLVAVNFFFPVPEAGVRVKIIEPAAADAAWEELLDIRREQEELRRDIERFNDLLDAYQRGELKSA